MRYQPHLYRFGLRMCGNVEDAGDVAQESLISMARSVRNFRGDSSVSSWLYTIARRFCIKKRRRSKFAPAREESLDMPETDVRPTPRGTGAQPGAGSGRRELATALTHAIQGLESAQREVLVLRDIEGLTAPEVARDPWPERRGRQEPAAPGEGRHPRGARAGVGGRPGIAPRRGDLCPDVLTLFSQHLEGDIIRARARRWRCI